MPILLIIVVLSMIGSSHLHADVGDPFGRYDEVSFDHNYPWVIDGAKAFKSGDGDGIWYKLHITEGAITLNLGSSDAVSLVLSKFSVYDVLLDGRRLRVFQQCLSSQERHSRFLQQGLKNRSGRCINNGDLGELVVIISTETYQRILAAKTLEFVIHPYRKEIRVEFSVDDYAIALNEIEAKEARAMALKKLQEVQLKQQQIQAPAPMPTISLKACVAKPPEGFPAIKSIKYVCSDSSAKSEASKKIGVLVAAETKRRKQLSDEAERKKKQLAEEAERRKKAIAESKARQEELNNVIQERMIKACLKSWANGHNRCYCEKYLEHAPSHVASNPDCAS